MLITKRTATRTLKPWDRIAPGSWPMATYDFTWLWQELGMEHLRG